jgi:beta-N-acetylhexosaminidase
MEEMRAVVASASVLAGKSLERANRALRERGDKDDANETAIRAEFAAMFEAAA